MKSVVRGVGRKTGGDRTARGKATVFIPVEKPFRQVHYLCPLLSLPTRVRPADRNKTNQPLERKAETLPACPWLLRLPLRRWKVDAIRKHPLRAVIIRGQ